MTKLEHDIYNVFKYSDYNDVTISKKNNYWIVVELVKKFDVKEKISLDINRNSFGFWLNLNYFNQDKIIANRINISISKEIFIQMLIDYDTACNRSLSYRFKDKDFSIAAITELPEDLMIIFHTPSKGKQEVEFFSYNKESESFGNWIKEHINNYTDDNKKKGENKKEYSEKIFRKIVSDYCSFTKNRESLFNENPTFKEDFDKSFIKVKIINSIEKDKYLICFITNEPISQFMFHTFHKETSNFGKWLTENLYTYFTIEQEKIVENTANFFKSDCISCNCASINDWVGPSFSNCSNSTSYIYPTTSTGTWRYNPITNSYGNDLMTYYESKINTKKEKENKSMFNFEFGSVDNSNIGISMYGLSIKNKAGKFVSYDSATQKIIDVEVMNISSNNGYIYKMPVAIKDIKVGDVISHMNTPMIVTTINGENNKLTAIDPFNSEEKTILPITNMFHFDYVIKYISLLSNMMGTPSEDQPFGNMLPLIFLNQKDGTNNNDLITAMMLMNMNSGETNNTNQMLPFLLMSGDSGSSRDNLLIYYMMMNNQSNNK